MVEAALLALDLLLVTYCCWIIVRVEKKSIINSSDFGIFAFKEKKGDESK